MTGTAIAVRTLCWTLAAAALAVTLWQLPDRVRGTYEDIRDAHAAPRAERRLVPAESVGLDTRIFAVAARLIPSDATYFVATPPGPSSGDLLWVRAFADYWLMPRHRVPYASDADWVLEYRGNLRSLGLRYARVTRIAPGFALAEVIR